MHYKPNCVYLVLLLTYSASNISVTLKSELRGHSGSLEMAPVDRSCMSSYLCFIITTALSRIVSEIKQDISRKSRDFFHIPPGHLHSTTPLEGPHPNIPITFGVEELERRVYQVVKKVSRYVSRFHTIPACDGRTYRQTSCHHSIVGAVRICVGR